MKKEQRDLMVRLATAANPGICEVLMDQVKEIKELPENNKQKMNHLEK